MIISSTTGAQFSAVNRQPLTLDPGGKAGQPLTQGQQAAYIAVDREAAAARAVPALVEHEVAGSTTGVHGHADRQAARTEGEAAPCQPLPVFWIRMERVAERAMLPP